MKRPSAADLALIDPDNSFRSRLLRDRDALTRLAATGDVRELEATVHRLAGAAATFGYAEVGTIATELDDAFVAARARGGVMPDVTRLIAAIRQALTQT